jgi:hypothetical protein
MTNPWANYNGKGRPITTKQLAELLARWGVKERFDENGNGYYDRKDFEPIWDYLDRSKQSKQ